MMIIQFKKPDFPIGYSSHGYVTTFADIAEAEYERENEPFIHYSEADIAQYAQRSAIWVTKYPIDAFRYCISAEESEWPKKDIIAKYPDWRDDIEEIETNNYSVLVDSDDGDDGVVLVELP